MKEKKMYERPLIIKQYSGFMNKFGSQSFTTPMSSIDGVLVKDMLKEYGSPLFVMSEKKIRNNQRDANRIFKTRYPKVQFAWSYKTNYLDAVCSVFHQEGSFAEVVSEFEYDKARGLGVSGKNIFFNGPAKTPNALIKASKDGAKIHIDNFDELYMLIELAATHKLKPNVAIRVNMDTGIYPQWDRFGFNYESGEAWQALKRICADDNLHLVGLHTHIGTYMMSADAYKIAASKMVDLAVNLKNKMNILVEYIDLGGGFASHNTLQGQYLTAEQIIPSFEDFADAISSSLFQTGFSTEDMPTLVLETGRALVDDAGFLLSTVIANKRLASGKKAIIVDAGVNLLFTSFWYKHKISPAQESGAYSENTVLYGPLCMNIDCIRDNINLPILKKGDSIVIHYAGAYDVTQWMQFITLRPNVVMVMEDGTVELIRKAESLDYILDREVVPKKLLNS